MAIRLRQLFISLAFGALCVGTAQAGPYTNLFVFGDSLSDTGNLSLATGGTQPPAGQPYFNGRFSDGPVWVEHLAAGLGLPAAPSLAGGNNYAFAGAPTGATGSPPGVLAQVAGLWAPTHAVADANALYVVVGGGNDMRDARSLFTGNTAADQAGRQAAAQAAVNNLFASLSILSAHGAQHVMLANLPDLGLTPEAALLGVQFASADVSARFSALMLGLEVLAEATLGLDIDLLDLAGIAGNVRNDALNNGGAVYGITNVSAPCTGFTFSAALGGTACSVSAFSDVLHPSARMHAIFGAAALSLAVPEPASAWLVLLAVAGLALQRRRSRTQTSASARAPTSASSSACVL